MKTIKTIVAVFTTAVVSVSGAEWYERVAMTSKNPFVLGTYIYEKILKTSYDVREGDSIAQGHVYLQLKQSEYASVFNSPNHRKVKTTGTPTANDITFIRQTLQSHADVAVPYFLQFLAGAPEVPSVIGVAFTFFDFLNTRPSSPKITATNVIPLLANGGQFDEVVVAGKDQSAHEFWNTSAVYRVMVGNETRNCVFYSATYAVKLIP